MIIAVKHEGTNCPRVSYFHDSGIVVRVHTKTRRADYAHVCVIDATGAEPRVYATGSASGTYVVKTREFAVRAALASAIADACVWYTGAMRRDLVAVITEVMDFIG